MKILVCPDKMKGSLSAGHVGRAIAAGMAEGLPGSRVKVQPLADGGEGFADILCGAVGARGVTVATTDAAGRPLRARYGWSAAKRTAVVELAAAAGLAQLPEGLRDPRVTTTFGVGAMVADALRRGARRVWVGLGGSATNDGGTGIARAFGWRFLDARGEDLPPGGLALADLERVEPPPGWDGPCGRAGRAEILVACDVRNPLTGPGGCSRVFGAQKGAGPQEVEALEKAMARLARVAGPALARRHGSGAAGGAAFGLVQFLGARTMPGFDVVAEAVGLRKLVAWADLVVTAEGALDAQSFGGKVAGGVLRMCAAAGRPMLVLAGSVPGAQKGLPKVACLPIVTGPMTLEDSKREAFPLLRLAAYRAALLVSAGRGTVTGGGR